MERFLLCSQRVLPAIKTGLSKKNENPDEQTPHFIAKKKTLTLRTHTNFVRNKPAKENQGKDNRLCIS